MAAFRTKESYGIFDLFEIMEILTGENGCPWDREQTHESIRINAIEEACEVVDAIDKGDRALLIEELGDLLLQPVLHCYIDRKSGGFGVDEVVDALCKKLVFRHLHIFGGGEAATGAEALNVWEGQKKKEKKFATVAEDMEALPKAFPQLLRAQKVQKKAAKAGLDFPSAASALGKVAEETDELRAAVAENNAGKIAEELGDCFFSLVNIARLFGLDSEMLLKASTDKFMRRFAYVENAAADRGGLKALTDGEKDELFEEAKAAERTGQ